MVQALLDSTDPAWLVIPHVPFFDRGRDGEADVVVVHPAHGAVVIEVKGGRITVREGRWHQDGRPLRRSPAEQAVGAKHALLRKVRGVADADGVDPLWFTHAVAFPDASARPSGSLGPELDVAMVFTGAELEWCAEALAALLPARKPVPRRVVASMVRALRPDLEFGDALAPELCAMSRRLDEETETLLRTAELLDTNRRVWVEGRAGTGKSRLAIRWARRAADRGERVMLLCFNRPMGAVFERVFADDERVTAGSFHDVALQLLAPTGFEVPADPDGDFWNDAVPTALLDHRDELGEGFDTIILDEVQDIWSHWFPAIEHLLDPTGAGRLYRLGDPCQNLYRVDVDDAEGWMRVPLATNCRNTKAIAAVAERVGGGPASTSSPEGPPVRFVEAGGVKEMRKRLRRELLALLREHHLPPSSVAVITTRAEMRDEILDPPLTAPKLVRWDERDEGAVVCETAHRLKGTEWEAVVAVNLEPATKEWLRDVLYVAVSRPRTWLSVIGSEETAEMLGLGAADADLLGP